MKTLPMRALMVLTAAAALYAAVSKAHDGSRASQPSCAGSVCVQNDIDPAPALASLAPDFTLPDLAGHTHSLSGTRGHLEILAFFCGCDRCRAAASKIAALQNLGKLQSVAAVIALDPDDARQFLHATGLRANVYLDPSDATADKYDSDFCPRLWGLKADGTIGYRSGEALEGADLTQALADLQPYGARN